MNTEVEIVERIAYLHSISPDKFYRIRGWEQRKKFLNDVSQEVEKYEE